MAPELRPDKSGVILTTGDLADEPDVVQMHASIEEDTRRGAFGLYRMAQEAAGKVMKPITYYYGEDK